MPKFVPRERKHKVLARRKQHGSHSFPSNGDVNAVELLPASKTEREERRQKLREELRAQQPRVSSKKQKRLDKYIDTKLKKDENLELIKKLASHKVDTSLFQSSKKLGRTNESKREILSRALRERQAGIDVEKNNALLYEAPRERREVLENESDSELDEPTEIATPAPPVEAAQPIRPSAPVTAAFGSGLKRPLEVDESGRPVLKKRKRTKAKSANLHAPEELEWEGFDPESEDDGFSETSLKSHDSGDENSSEDGTRTSSSDGDDLDTSGEESEDETSEEEEEEVDMEERQARRERSSAFKAWATKQRNDALGFTPSAIVTNDVPTINVNFKPRPAEDDPLPPELETTTTDTARKAFSVAVERDPDIQEARLALPVVAEEQKIMEAVHNNNSVVIWGATGSGKTTQVPQFLYEAGYGSKKGPTPDMIGVTQPRRVAAVSMSKRVGEELGKGGKDKVAYQIRFESSVKDNTAVKFMTDGVLLREIAQDFALMKYSAIIVDEAHERSVNTDILIGMMSRIVNLRATMAREDPSVKPLKLVIMSATLRISDFTENKRLFRDGPPPLMKAEGRQYPVTVHFARRTQRDYLEEAFRKVSKGHKKLPHGGMLVFLTGQNEITALAKRLRETFASTSSEPIKQSRVQYSAAEAPLEAEDIEIGGHQHPEDDDGSDADSEIHGLDEDEDREFDIGEDAGDALKVHVLPLYSQLPTQQQLRVFEPPPEGSRLIVLATNVAETSLTIPGIRYVFDCGRSKEKKYDRTTGVQSFEVGWISKASASQRTGRAGRTGPGHCYRLYSSAVYERDFEEYAEPEILRTPIEGVVLQLKSMDLQNVVNFPFPTPPDRASLAKAEKLLTYLGAIDQAGKITATGRELSAYPLTPRFSRMLLIGQAHNVTAYAIALVATLAVPDIFIPENQLDLATPVHSEDHIQTASDNMEATAREKRRKDYNTAHATLSRWDRSSDALKLLTALCAYAYASDTEVFCSSMFLRSKALKEASQLREQLSAIVRTHKPGSLGSYVAQLAQPSSMELKVLKQIVAAGFIDQVAIRADLSPSPPSLARKPKRAIDVPYLTLSPSHIGPYSPDEKEAELQRFVYLHPSSVLARTAPPNLPRYVVFSHLQRASPAVASSAATRVRMHALTPVSGLQLAALAAGTPLLEYGKLIGKIETLERLDGAERRECWVVPALVGEKGKAGWPLPAKRVVQRRTGGGEWSVERVIG